MNVNWNVHYVYNIYMFLMSKNIEVLKKQTQKASFVDVSIKTWPLTSFFDRTLLFQLWSVEIYEIKRVQKKQQVIIILHKQSGNILLEQGWPII